MAARRTIRLSRNFVMPLEAVTETFAFIGNRGSGKSSSVTRFIEQLHAADQQVVVLDVKGDYWGIRSSADGKGPGLPFVIFGGEHADVPLEPTAGALIADAIVDYRISAIIDLSLMSKTKARSFATAFAERLYERNRDPLHLVIEEADVLVPQRADANTFRLIGAMEDIAKRGRHRGLGLTIATQRGQEVAQSVLDLMETVVLLRITGRLTMKAIRDWIAVNADADETSARDVTGTLPALAVGEAWVWSPAFLRTVKRVQLELFTTFDSHRTPKPGERRIVPRQRAEIDLAKLGEEIAATVERAKAADPSALQNKVAELTRQLSTRERELATVRAELEQARSAEPEVIETVVPALPDNLVTVRRIAESIVATLGEQGDKLATLLGNAEHVVEQMHAWQEDAKTSSPRPGTSAKTSQTSRVPSKTSYAPAGRPTTLPVRPAVPVGTGEGVRLPKAQRVVLSALAPYAPRSRSKRQVAMLTGYSGKGGGFNNAMSALRTAGYISGGGDAIAITEPGIAALGEYTPLPTGQALLDHWLAQLPKAAKLILAALAEAWPQAMSKEEVAVATDYEPSGGGFNNALSRLRTLELIFGTGAELRASDDLMDVS